MKCSLEIRRGADTVLSRELAPGEYSLGRKEGNDIVLADRSISGRHAVVTVGKKKVVVADAGSRNGVLLQGKRIKRQSFAKDFAVELGPFLLTFALGASVPATEGKKADRAKALFASLNPRLLVYGVLFSFALFMAVVYYAPLKAGWESGREREALTRGILLVRYLGAVNQLPLEEKRMDVLRTDPSNTEEGVRYAYVVDPYGKVLAPAQEMGKFLKLRKIDKALADPQLRSWEGEDGEEILFYPIKEFDTLLGAAIIGYDLERAAAVQGGGVGATAALLFLVSLAVAGGCGFVLLRGFLTPLRALSEEAGVSLKQRQDHLAFQAPYAELRALVETMNRMLLLVCKTGAPASAASGEREAPSQTTPSAAPARPVAPSVEPVEPTAPAGPAGPAGPGEPDMEATYISLEPPAAAVGSPPDREAGAGPAEGAQPVSEAASKPTPEPAQEPAAELVPDQTPAAQQTGAEGAADLGSLAVPACHIDLQQYTVVAFNPAFCSFFAGGEKKQGMHMLEAFQDPELISAISTLIDDRQPEAEAVAPGERSVAVRKETMTGAQEGIALFTFREASDG